MGRWSRRLAWPFLDFAGVDRGAVLDVGCGTVSLTFLLAERAGLRDRVRPAWPIV